MAFREIVDYQDIVSLFEQYFRDDAADISRTSGYGDAHVSAPATDTSFNASANAVKAASSGRITRPRALVSALFAGRGAGVHRSAVRTGRMRATGRPVSVAAATAKSYQV